MTSSATGCCSPSRSAWSRRSTTATSSSTRSGPGGSFAERKRLFELPARPGTTTTAPLISPGGGVWSRQREVDPAVARGAARARRRRADRLHAERLLSAILKAPVDLFWNGGIGTFVKAIDGDARGRRRPLERRHPGRRGGPEGAGRRRGRQPRPHAARPDRVRPAGGRVNTDFIDNSAGVDSSDHEVNLKILLGIAVAAAT